MTRLVDRTCPCCGEVALERNADSLGVTEVCAACGFSVFENWNSIVARDASAELIAEAARLNRHRHPLRT